MKIKQARCPGNAPLLYFTLLFQPGYNLSGFILMAPGYRDTHTVPMKNYREAM